MVVSVADDKIHRKILHFILIDVFICKAGAFWAHANSGLQLTKPLRVEGDSLNKPV